MFGAPVICWVPLIWLAWPVDLIRGGHISVPGAFGPLKKSGAVNLGLSACLTMGGSPPAALGFLEKLHPRTVPASQLANLAI